MGIGGMKKVKGGRGDVDRVESKQAWTGLCSCKYNGDGLFDETFLQQQNISFSTPLMSVTEYNIMNTSGISTMDMAICRVNQIFGLANCPFSPMQSENINEQVKNSVVRFKRAYMIPIIAEKKVMIMILRTVRDIFLYLR